MGVLGHKIAIICVSWWFMALSHRAFFAHHIGSIAQKLHTVNLAPGTRAAPCGRTTVPGSGKERGGERENSHRWEQMGADKSVLRIFEYKNSQHNYSSTTQQPSAKGGSASHASSEDYAGRAGGNNPTT